MLPRSNKVTRKKEVEELAKKGRRCTSAFFIIKVLPNNTQHNRFVIVVSGKVHKKAVKRNKIRRQVREIIRTDLLQGSRGHDVMVVVKDTALEQTFAELRNDLSRTFKRATTNPHLA